MAEDCDILLTQSNTSKKYHLKQEVKKPNKHDTYTLLYCNTVCVLQTEEMYS